MEDDLKISKVEYLSNHWLDLSQILYQSSGDQTKLKNEKWRWPPIEDNLQLLKVEYLSNHCSDLPPILNLSSGDQTKTKMLKMKMISNWRQHQTIQSWIYQQPLIGSSSNYKLKLRGLNQNQKYLKWRWSSMEGKKINIRSWISQIFLKFWT